MTLVEALKQTSDKYTHARENASAWYSLMCGMVEDLEKSEVCYIAERAIHESVLSVEVRSGWYAPGNSGDGDPSEYRITLTTGGPALQLVGELDKYCTPQTARLEMQDWGVPWQEHRGGVNEKVLLAFAAQFYFGG